MPPKIQKGTIIKDVLPEEGLRLVKPLLAGTEVLLYTGNTLGLTKTNYGAPPLIAVSLTGDANFVVVPKHCVRLEDKVSHTPH